MIMSSILGTFKEIFNKIYSERSNELSNTIRT